MSTIDSERPQRADARRNRERILESAREVYAEHGVDAQMDDIAARAGVGVGTVYRHFPTKEALTGELIRQKFRMLADEVGAGLERDGDPFDVVADTLQRAGAICAQDASMQHALAGAGDWAWDIAAPERAQLAEATAELIARAQRAGKMRRDITPSDIGMLMCGISATVAAKSPGFDWRRHLELALDMLRAR